DQAILGELLAELPGERREQKERQNEQQRAEVDQQILVHRDTEKAVGQGQLEQDRQDHRLLIYVVVERTQRLGEKERQKTLLAEQCELRFAGHVPCPSM